VTLNLVWVQEKDAPEGEPAVSWTLLTTEPVDNEEQLLRVIDIYRARWTIEEYFKALKTGCAIEKRQLGSYDALVRTLAMFMPVAWKLLSIRHWADREPDACASVVLSTLQIKLLRFLLKDDRSSPLPKSPTVRDVWLGLALLGGHIKHRKEAPGWIVLGRGFDDLQQAEVGARAMMEM